MKPDEDRFHADFDRVREAAAEAMPEGRHFVHWVNSHQAALDNERPITLIARGETERVLALIHAIAEGAFL